MPLFGLIKKTWTQSHPYKTNAWKAIPSGLESLPISPVPRSPAIYKPSVLGKLQSDQSDPDWSCYTVHGLAYKVCQDLPRGFGVMIAMKWAVSESIYADPMDYQLQHQSIRKSVLMQVNVASEIKIIQLSSFPDWWALSELGSVRWPKTWNGIKWAVSCRLPLWPWEVRKWVRTDECLLHMCR